MRKIIYIIAAVLGVCSCVYPFSDFAETESKNLVVEGDIVIGGLSYFLPTSLQSLNDLGEYKLVPSTIWVESEDGKTYPAELKDNTYGYVADLTDADASKSYRLRVDTGNKHYASQWGKAEGSVVIDGLKYQLDTAGQQLKMQIGLHTDGNSRHFRYRYFEDWEYHAYARAYLYYDPVKDTVQKFEGADNTFYCWRTGLSRGLNLATTEKMSVDRLEDYTFKTIPNNDERLSVMYKIRIDVYPVSSVSYAYYENVRDNSSPTGDLFSPMPSEVRGNIRNMEDDSETVYGYVAVVVPASATIYYSNEVGKFYHNTQVVEYEEIALSEKQYKRYYTKGYLPVYEDFVEGIKWGPARCVDCRLSGGTRNKPEGWPTSAY